MRGEREEREIFRIEHINKKKIRSFNVNPK